MVEGVNVLKWRGGELHGKSALHPDWNRRSLLQRRIRLRAFIFVLVIVPNLAFRSFLLEFLLLGIFLGDPSLNGCQRFPSERTEQTMFFL
jgi:hypothetical protein